MVKITTYIFKMEDSEKAEYKYDITTYIGKVKGENQISCIRCESINDVGESIYCHIGNMHTTIEKMNGKNKIVYVN